MRSPKAGSRDHEHSAATRNLLVSDVQPGIIAGFFGSICRPVVLVFVPQPGPSPVCLRARWGIGKGNVADDGISRFGEMMACQSLQQTNLCEKVELVQNIGGYDTVKALGEFCRPVAQQVGLYEPGLR